MDEDANVAKAEGLDSGQGHCIPGDQEFKSGVWKVVALSPSPPLLVCLPAQVFL